MTLGRARVHALARSAAPLGSRALRSWSLGREDARFQFKCTACGKCCTGHGGRVRVNESEVAAIASLLHRSPADVKARFLRRLPATAAGDPEAAESGSAGADQQQQQWALQQTPDDTQCVFLDGSKCSIYKGSGSVDC